MGVSASMQSLLVRQLLALKEPGWAIRYPNDWLVWEPGAWKVPELKVSSTQVAVAQPDRPQTGDCLCFELKPVAGAKLKLGRAPENDICVNDATVSREHLVLERPKDQWRVQVLVGSKATLVNKVAVQAASPQPLSSGQQLTVGGVTLTYLTASGLLARVKAEAARLAVVR